jgi:Phosphoribosyltransferase
VASRIASAVTDYCLFCRSQRQLGLDAALRLFHSSAMLELNLDSTDGCGAAMSWPLVRAASALLTDVVDSDDTTATPPSTSLLSLGGDQSQAGDDPLLLRALGGDRPAAPRRGASPPAQADTPEPAVISEIPSTPLGWHSPFNQGEGENVSAASKVDTRQEPGSTK